MSSNPRTFEPTSVSRAYFQANELLGDRRNCKLANETYLRRIPMEGGISAFYHGWEIISYTEERIALNTWGYNTHSTRARFNWFLPKSIRVYQKDHVLYLDYLKRTHKFRDGMSLLPMGKVLPE